MGSTLLSIFFLENTAIKEQLINEQIREKELRVIAANGDMLGIMSSREAMSIADREELDLVLISPQAKPPVAKIMDYGKYKFEMVKKSKEAKKKQKVVETKEVRLSATIDTNDIAIKAKNAVKFLQDENKVKASIRLKGRQNARPEMAIKVMDAFFELVKDYGTKQAEPKKEGNTVSMLITPIVAKPSKD